MIHGHGDDIGQYGATIRANFSSNVWYGGLNPGLSAHLQDKIAAVTHYPDPAAETLRQAAATSYGLHPDQVLVTNGATEAIYLVAQAFSPYASSVATLRSTSSSSATILIPSFAEYADACRIHGLETTWLPWGKITPATRFHHSLVFICNPNNPTGDALSTDLLQQLLQNNPDPLFVIDESYIEFTDTTNSLIPLLAAYPNLLILRSLTKSCCIPGLRLGFALGHSDRIRSLQLIKMPWSVNRLAIEAGLYIFRNPQQFTLPLAQLLAATAGWRGQLQDATGWTIHPTDTHYFLVEMRVAHTGVLHPPDHRRPTDLGACPATAATLKQWLIREHGLLIRDASNFRGLTPYHFRVACQSPEHNQYLTDALRQCSQTGI
ncbi:MAG TPA: aminotransferase class I/II-fold pyridoxal phosphate-dependent enzyme [Puia sp.]|jgi:threonine-phosphate decarboxylase